MGNCASCWVMTPTAPTMCSWGSHGRGFHTCLPRQMAASVFLSFYCRPYSGILLGPSNIPRYQPVLLASLFATLSATVDERKSVRCQAQGHSGVTLTPLGAPSIEVAPQLLVPNTPQRFWRSPLY